MMRIPPFAIALLLFALTACHSTKKEGNPEVDYSANWQYLSQEQLVQLGILINDSAIIYNNKVDGVGSLDLVIMDRDYMGNMALTQQTSLPFYPRYITTLDTMQRAMYMLTGNEAHSEEEAHRWESFESLVPVVVEQKYGEIQFGETLIFWMTKTPELKKLLNSL
ncbi:MAG: hypothetical protein PHT92_09765 [Bacteroidales bacterium]|jgi:hypothetical protein|nr:hypothetical protein [Bacteroidales bacterium]